MTDFWTINRAFIRYPEIVFRYEMTLRLFLIHWHLFMWYASVGQFRCKFKCSKVFVHWHVSVTDSGKDSKKRRCDQLAAYDSRKIVQTPT